MDKGCQNMNNNNDNKIIFNEKVKKPFIIDFF